MKRTKKDKTEKDKRGKFNLIEALLIFVLIALYLNYTNANPTWIFATAVIALIPLAEKMGKATDELAKHYGEHIGGLLNAAFGNAAELIIAIIAVQEGLIDLVRASLSGSIIGNLLFVLGSGLLVGGLKYKEQKFSEALSGMNSTMLLIAFLSIMIPSLFHILPGHTISKEINLSVIISILLLLVYGASLVFSLKTHKDLFMNKEKNEKPEWSKQKAVIVLLVATVFLALVSEALVGQVEHVVKNVGMSEIFIGAVVVAIVGNAAEHLSAVRFSLENKVEVAINITVGSSLQIAMFVAPLAVLIGVYGFNQPMDLVFSPLELIAVFASVLVVNEISNDSKFNWFEGLQLIVMYLIIAALFYLV